MSAAGAEKSSNFFLGFLFLGRERKEALAAVYAYCRLIDDIVDEGALTREQAGARLDYWTAEIERLFAGAPSDPIARRLAPAVERFKLPKEPFLEMIRGCRMDLEQTRYESYAELESYMRGVACSVGQLSVEIFGYRHTPKERIREFATLFGYAFQLTNIIRDVGADLELGRVYLPESEMREAGYSREQLVERAQTPALEALLRRQYARARDCYARARALVDPRDRPALVPAEVMAHVYEALLEDIRRGGFRVLFRKAALSPARKLGLAVKAWLFCHGF